MRPANQPDVAAQDFLGIPAFDSASRDDARLRDALKRYSPQTREAACQFRRTGNAKHLPAIVHGLIEHCVASDARAKLERGGDDLRLVEDLAIDSLTMLEIVFLAEEVLGVTIENEEVRPLRTVRDIKKFMASKLRGRPTKGHAPAQDRPELRTRPA
jgi:3-hydroxyacyl-[acyl-carrier-protein] dehydratase